MPVADTDPADRPAGATVEMVPGRYSFVAVGAGFGHKRSTDQSDAVWRPEPPAVAVDAAKQASAANGASAAGDGVDQAQLIDEDRGHELAVAHRPGPGQAGHRRPRRPQAGAVDRVQVSAMLRPTIAGDPDAGGRRTASAPCAVPGPGPVTLPRR